MTMGLHYIGLRESGEFSTKVEEIGVQLSEN